MPGFDHLSKALHRNSEQDKTAQEGRSIRDKYPAIVVKSDDPLDQGRIIARIVDFDETGAIKGGRDRDIPDDKLPFAVPSFPSFLHAPPLEGEMVYIFLENPNVNTSPRYWTGPIITSKLKLKFQSINEAIKVFNYTQFGLNSTVPTRPSQFRVWPEKSDVALLGRDDSMLLLKPREVYLNAGAFKRGTVDPNLEHPSFIQMRQFDVKPDGNFNTNPIEYSQTNIVSTNINLYSPRGKFRKEDAQQYEIGTDLQNFGEMAQRLHPTVFGDELVKLLNLMIQFMRTHIHTPQKPPVSDPLLTALEEYTIPGKLQDILSNHVRVN